MKLKVAPEGMLEHLAFATGKVPRPFVRLFWSMGTCRTMVTALELGVFDALSNQSQTAEKLADRLECDLRGITTLLNALNGFDLLKRTGSAYGLTKDTRRWLSREEKNNILDAFLFAVEFEKLLVPLTEQVRTGLVVNFHHQKLPPEFWRRYMFGLASFARQVSGLIARAVKFPTAPGRLLDVGGGHGMYTAGFCRRYPTLQAEILDLPEAILPARELVAETDVADRITFREGDLRETQWGQDYDAVLLFNVMHTLEGPVAAGTIQKAHAALAKGGTLVILDAEHNHGQGNISSAAGFAELFFYSLSAAQAWPEEQLRSWMETAGFTHIRRKRTFGIPQVLLTGHKT